VSDQDERAIAIVDEFMRAWGYAPTSADAREYLVEKHGLTAEQAEAAVVAWEASNERPEEGRAS
jgi:hypothetical protein